jgi:hypothetical protein
VAARAHDTPQKNKVEEVEKFSAPQKCHPTHHVYHAFHHDLTTFLPSKNTVEISKPPVKTPHPPPTAFFCKKP